MDAVWTILGIILAIGAMAAMGWLWEQLRTGPHRASYRLRNGSWPEYEVKSSIFGDTIHMHAKQEPFPTLAPTFMQIAWQPLGYGPAGPPATDGLARALLANLAVDPQTAGLAAAMGTALGRGRVAEMAVLEREGGDQERAASLQRLADGIGNLTVHRLPVASVPPHGLP